jgi:3-oxosteroid 1-dehydrogenase
MSDFDETFDFVVVGSGGGSMCAALAMRAGGKSVLICEKTDLIGGTTARSGGVMWIPDNPFMARDGVADSPERAATYLDTLVGDAADAPGTSPERRRVYIDQAPRMIDFLLKQGIKLTRVRRWPDYYDDLPGGSADGRTVIADLFDLNRLGPWKQRLRPGFLMMPATLPEMMALPTFRRTWTGKRAMARVALRTVTSRLTGRRYASAGAGLQGWMLDAALRAGADIRTGTPVSELVVDDGRATGVVAVRDGRPWRVGARLGVLVNAGGFAKNQAMRDRWQPGTRIEWSMAAPGDTGEMIEEMVRHGACLAQMEERVGYQTTIPPGAEDADVKPPAQAMTAAPHAILVDRTGVRYQNEGGSYMAYCKGMMERDKSVPAVPSFAVFDSSFMRSYMLGGTMPGSRKPQRWFDEGYLRKADTIEALARAIGAPPANLVATVARFNGFVERGRDEDFGRGDRAYDNWLGDQSHRPSPTLGTIAEAPFYAVPVLPGDVSTYGGVVTDADARVLREDGTAIDGLYATGVSTASVMGRAYPGAGASVGPSFTWGYVAAKHAAGLGNLLP